MWVQDTPPARNQRGGGGGRGGHPHRTLRPRRGAGSGYPTCTQPGEWVVGWGVGGGCHASSHHLNLGPPGGGCKCTIGPPKSGFAQPPRPGFALPPRPGFALPPRLAPAPYLLDPPTITSPLTSLAHLQASPPPSPPPLTWSPPTPPRLAWRTPSPPGSP